MRGLPDNHYEDKLPNSQWKSVKGFNCPQKAKTLISNVPVSMFDRRRHRRGPAGSAADQSSPMATGPPAADSFRDQAKAKGLSGGQGLPRCHEFLCQQRPSRDENHLGAGVRCATEHCHARAAKVDLELQGKRMGILPPVISI